MALFGRDYDRNYGYRGTGGYRMGGYDRDLGDRMRAGMNRMGNSVRRGMNRVENAGRDAFDMGGYDRDYNRGYGATGYRDAGYDRDFNFNRTSRLTAGTYGAYDRDYGTTTGAMGYDRNYKSQAQTDYGDPFGDRQSRTPIRVIRGEYENQNRYDNQYRGMDRNRNMTYRATRYDRDYSSNPMGYDPGFGSTNYNRGTYNRGYDRNF